MDEKKWLEEIEKSARKIQAPDSLSPEKIKARLDAKMTEKDQADVPPEDRAITPRKKMVFWKKYGAQAAGLAAAAIILFVSGYQIGSSQDVRRGGESAWSETQSGSETPRTSAAQTPDTAESATEEAQTPNAAENAAKDAQEKLAPIGDEDALYEKLLACQNGSLTYAAEDGMGAAEIEEEIMPLMSKDLAVAQSAAGTAETAAAPVPATTTAGDYSQTNLRELGVDEGDLVKTDGAYIYVLKRSSSVKVIRADGSRMELAATIEPEDLNEAVRDLYVDGERLILVTGGSRSSLLEKEDSVYTPQSYDYAKVLTYDISDHSAPRLLGSVEQEGYYHSSRKAGDDIYLFTEFWPQVESSKEDSRIMPLVNGTAVQADDIYVPETFTDTRYLVIGSVNIAEPKKAVCHKAVVSGVNHFYVSAESIFICNQSWQEGHDVTEVMKFSYQDGEVQGVGMTSINGYLNDTFSLDEYNGYLRVVATDWNNAEEVNALYVYDESMKLVGRIADIAPGETIRSARFLGDSAYFVTFRQTDPLFSVDLSDPENPQILGALKVNGFSSYLHFYGEDKLLGIGYEADADTGITSGIKLSMFDITDPANIREIQKFVLDEADSCPGLANYKAIMINPEKNLFGFVCDQNYLVFTYDEEEGFRNLLTCNLAKGQRQENYWYAYEDVRGLYIADTFYLADAEELRAFDMTQEFSPSAKLEF